MLIPLTIHTATLEEKMLREVVCEKCHQEYLYLHLVSVRGSSSQLIHSGVDQGPNLACAEAEARLSQELKDGVDDAPCPRCGWVQDHMLPVARRKKKADKILLFSLICLVLTGFGLFPVLAPQVEFLLNPNRPRPQLNNNDVQMILYGLGSAFLLALAIIVWRTIVDLCWSPNNSPLEQRLAKAAERSIKREEYLKIVEREGGAEAIAQQLSRRRQIN